MQKISINLYFNLLIAFFTALIAYFIAAYLLIRSEFVAYLSIWLLIWLSSVGLAYLLIKKIAFTGKKNNFIALLFTAGLLFRLIGLLSIPALSDDYFRFIWDGRLGVAGFNPFDTRPEEWLNSPLFTQLKLGELYQHLNSPRYYSVYPPLSQVWFYMSTYFAHQELNTELFFLRLFIIGAEIGSFYLLLKLLVIYQRPIYYAAFYWLNPLIIIELSYNLHFEAVQIFFLLLTLYAVETQKYKLVALALAAAAVAKLLPLIFVPLLWCRLGLWRGFWVLAATFCIFVGSFLPFFSLALIEKIGSSVGLYFKNFEFNASIYYLTRQVGFWVYGNNQIAVLGRTLSLIALFFVFYIAKKAEDKSTKLPELMLATLTVYYLLATTVHPWYISNLLIFAALTSYRYVLIWSFFIFLTYKSYENVNLYEENLYLVAIEYLAVGLYFCYEKGCFFGKKA